MIPQNIHSKRMSRVIHKEEKCCNCSGCDFLVLTQNDCTKVTLALYFPGVALIFCCSICIQKQYLFFQYLPFGFSWFLSPSCGVCCFKVQCFSKKSSEQNEALQSAHLNFCRVGFFFLSVIVNDSVTHLVLEFPREQNKC